MSHVLEGIYNTLKYGTAIDALRYRLKLMGIDIVLYYLMEETPHFCPSSEFNERSRDYTFGSLGPEDMKTVRDIYPLKFSEEYWLSLLKKGKKCLAAKYNGQIVAVMWLALDECDAEWGRFKLKENEAYAFHMFTRREFRGQHLAEYLHYENYDALKAMGRNRIYTYVSAFNKPSLKLKKRLNARFLKLGFHIGIFKKFERNFIIRNYA